MAAGKLSASRRGDASNVSKKVSVCCESDGDFDFRVKIKCNPDAGVGLEYDDGFAYSPPQKKRKLFSFEDGAICDSLCFDDDHEPGQLEEEDFTRAPSILRSRWANEDGDGEKGEGGSSPESGVTQKEDLEVSGSRSSGSDGGRMARVECYASDSEDDDDDGDFMEIGVSDDGEGDRSGGCVDGKRNMLQCCRSVFDYEKLGKISEGSYGIVYKARDKVSGEFVALKKMKMGDQREGFPVYYLREINTLMSLNHPSVVNVREVVVDDSVDGFNSIYLVMDYVEHDLKALMQVRKVPFRQGEVKCLMIQLLEGVKYLHDNWVLHRDLKTSNLLLNNKGELKICDFGMARQYGSPLKPYTSLVVTLWYRAPELLLGAKEYSTAVDMWSLGCIMSELLTNKPLFDGKTEVEQIDKIFRTLGKPNDKIWPGYSQLPGVKANFVHQPFNQLHKKFPRASFTGSTVLSDYGLDLLTQLLTYNPENRITAEEALNHPWFQEVPFPSSRDFMPSFPADKVVLSR